MADAILGGIVINEIHAQPVGGGGFDTDGNGTVSALDEYVEFYNASGAPIDMSGLQLWDPGTGNWFTFPSGSVIAAGGYALVVTGVQAGGSLPPVPTGSLAFNAGRSTAVLNNPGDNIYLLDPASQTFIAAAYGNWPLMDPTNPATWGVRPSGASVAGLAGFPGTATQIGAGESFGPLIAGSAIQRQPDGGNTFYNNAPAQTGPFQGTPGFDNICFAAGTRLATARGHRLIETFAPGDRVLLASGRKARVRWIGMRRYALAEILTRPSLWPIVIAPGALGPGVPAATLRVSPQHRVLVSGKIVQRVTGQAKGLVAAQCLLDLPGVSQPRPEAHVTYVHVMFDRHETVLAEGVVCESLYLGPVARAAIAPAALHEIFTIFPDLAAQHHPTPAVPLVPVRMARKLVARHARHARPLQVGVAALSARG